MAGQQKFSFKLFSPHLVMKAMQTFDRATTLVVSVCWGVATFMVIAAVYTLMISISARHEADTALVVEPALPKISHQPMDPKGAQKVFDRMQHRFSDINFSLRGKDLLVASGDGTKFHQWLMALRICRYHFSRRFHWTINEFCVGKCANMELMHASLTGDHVNFETPDAHSQNSLIATSRIKIYFLPNQAVIPNLGITFR